MTALRIVTDAETKMVSVIDEATGLVEIVEMSVADDVAVIDTIIEEEPDVSGRYHYTP